MSGDSPMSLRDRTPRCDVRSTDPSSSGGLAGTIGQFGRRHRPAGGRAQSAESGRQRVLVERRSLSRPNASSVRRHLSQSGPTLKLDRQRVRCWRQRGTASRLDDQPPGAIRSTASSGGERPRDRAVRGVGRSRSVASQARSPLLVFGTGGWVSPSTVDRILARHGSRSRGRTAALGEEAWPQRVQWSLNKLCCWDGSQFARCRAARYAHAIVDIATPSGITSLLTSEHH